MYRIDNADAATALPVPSPVAQPGYFTGGNPQAGQAATIVDADWLNAVQEEIAHVIEQAGLVLSKTDRTQLWQAIAGQRIILSAPLNLYVATTGNDANDGLTAGTPLATLQAAIDKVQNRYILNGYYATINVADGAYGACVLTGLPHGSFDWKTGAPIRVVGNTANPQNVTINLSATDNAAGYSEAFGASLGGWISLTGATLTNAVANGGCMGANDSSQISFSNVRFGASTGGVHISAQGGAIIGANGPYSIVGSANAHITASEGGHCDMGGCPSVTLTGAPAFPSGYANCTNSATINQWGTVFNGAATGPHFQVTTNGVINTQGAGGTYFPGSAAGIQNTGGQYI